MLQNRISGLPVVGPKGELVGMVTEGDFLRRGEIGTQRRRNRWLEFLVGPGRLADEYVHTRGRKVEEVMTREPVTVTEDTPLDEVVRLMERHRIKRLPVLREGKLVGIVTRANIMHALVSLAAETKAPAGDDAAIREQILAECAKQSWAPMSNVVVRNGVVELWGTITDERERAALIVAAENVPGVKTVHDHLVWIEPNSGFVIQSEEDEAPHAPRSETSPRHIQSVHKSRNRCRGAAEFDLHQGPRRSRWDIRIRRRVDRASRLHLHRGSPMNQAVVPKKVTIGEGGSALAFAAGAVLSIVSGHKRLYARLCVSRLSVCRRGRGRGVRGHQLLPRAAG